MGEDTIKESMKDRRIMDIMLRLCHDIFLRNFQQMSEMDLHPGQAAMLKCLHRQDGLTQRELAKNLHIKPPTVAVTIKRMEKADLLSRRPDPQDQRKTRIYLSDKGRDMLDRIKGIMEVNDQDLFDGFTEAELCLLRRFLLHMMENMARTMPEGGFDGTDDETERTDN